MTLSENDANQFLRDQFSGQAQINLIFKISYLLFQKKKKSYLSLEQNHLNKFKKREKGELN